MSARKMKKAEKDPSEGLRMTWLEICRKQKGLMMAMIVLAALSGMMLIFSLTTLRPQNTVVIVGYGDVYGEIAGISGGYRRESWANMLAYPVLALVFGLVHNLLVLRIYRKYGKDAALVLAVVTMLLVVTAVVVMLRLMGEW